MTWVAVIHPRDVEKALPSCRKYNKSTMSVVGGENLPGDSDAWSWEIVLSLSLENH